MRKMTWLNLVLAAVPLAAFAQQEAAATPPFVVEQTYWIKPGRESQFIGLFEKNRVAPLRTAIKEGRVLWLRVARPQFNATNEQWDLRVTVAWRDANSAIERSPQPKHLAMEQQIMEELLLERTDVPVQEWNPGEIAPARQEGTR